MLSKIVKE